MKRGRPAETPIEIKEKWEMVTHEFPTKPELGWTSIWYYDINTDKIGEKVSDEDYETYYDDDKFDELFDEYKSNI